MDNGNFWIVILFIIVSLGSSLLKRKPKDNTQEEEYIFDNEMFEQFIEQKSTPTPTPTAPIKKRAKKRIPAPVEKENIIQEEPQEPLFADLDEVRKAVITAEILQRKF